MTEHIFLKILLVTFLTKDAVTAGETEEGAPVEGETLPPEGKLVEIAQAPYTVAIYAFEFYHCTGSYIKDQWILTSGYCLAGKYPKDIQVIMGTKKLNDIAEVREVISIKVHPDYSAVPPKNDVGLLAVKEAFTINKTIDFLPLSNHPPDYKLTCSLVGWGLEANRTKTILSNETVLLRKVDLKLMQPDVCNDSFAEQTAKFDQSFVDESTVCAEGDFGDVCIADLGAALVCNNEQIGIASVIVQECGTGNVSVHTNVYHFKSWIESNMVLITKSTSALLRFNYLMIFKISALIVLFNRI